MVIEAIGKHVGGKVVTAVLVVSSAGAGIWFWKNPDDLRTIWLTIKFVLVWLGIVLALPWAAFFVTSWVVARDSNAAAALMLAGFLVVDVLVAVVLMGGVRGHHMLTWMVLLLGFLSAGVYNFKVCEFQADRLEDS